MRVRYFIVFTFFLLLFIASCNSDSGKESNDDDLATDSGDTFSDFDIFDEESLPDDADIEPECKTNDECALPEKCGAAGIPGECGKAEGEVLWSRSFGSMEDDHGNGVVMDAKGNLYVTGALARMIHSDDPDMAEHEVNYDVFLRKISPKGDLEWEKFFASDVAGAEAEAKDIAIDSGGNIVITGYFVEELALGEKSYKSRGARDLFIIKVDSSGELIWAKTFGGIGQDIGFKVALDSADNIYAAGEFGDWSVDFGGGRLLVKEGQGFFILKLDKNGNHLHSKGWQGPGEVYGLECDGEDRVIISGWINGSVDFGNGSLDSNRGHIYIAKMSSSFEALWSRNFEGPVWNAITIKFCNKNIIAKFRFQSFTDKSQVSHKICSHNNISGKVYSN